MRCPSCADTQTKVVDSRDTGDAIRRRRECLKCGHRFTTHERIERRVLWVVKREGRKEPFSPEKIKAGLALACRKRPLDEQVMEDLVRQVTDILFSTKGTEVSSAEVGEMVMRLLRDRDEVAYVRFASVYQAFESVDQFMDAVNPLKDAE